MNWHVIHRRLLTFSLMALCSGQLAAYYTGRPYYVKKEKKESLPLEQVLDKDIRECDEQEARDQQEADSRSKQGSSRHKKMDHKPLYAFDVYGRPVTAVVYKDPAWPLFAQPHEQPSLLRGGMTLSIADRGFDNRGHSVPLADVVFGKNIEFQDIVAASKLAQLGVFDRTNLSEEGLNANNLVVLAQEPVKFRAHAKQLVTDIGYIGHFFGSKCSLGANLPLVVGMHSLALANDGLLREKVNARLGAGKWTPGSSFETATLGNLIIDMAAQQKGMDVKNLNSSTAGIGDVSLFARYEPAIELFEFSAVGLRMVLATASQDDASKLWPATTFSGEAPMAQLFGSFIYAHSRFINPHAYGSFSVGLPTSIRRRVAREVSMLDIVKPAPAIAPLIPSNKVALADTVHLAIPSVPFQPFFDSTVPGFGTDVQSLHVRRGAQVELRVGNIIEQFFSPNAFLDIGYSLRLRDKNLIHARKGDQAYDAQMWTARTNAVFQMLMATYSYQFNNQLRLMAGASYIFAGRNADEKLFLNASLQLEF